MAMGFRNPLSKSLAASIMPGDQPDYGMGNFPMPRPPMGEQPQSGGLFKPGSKGQIIAGIIGDALAAATGGQPLFTQQLMQQRRDDQAEAQWTRRRMAEREEKQWEWQNKPPEVPAILRNVQAWQSLTDDQRKAYQAMQDAERGPITVLPNGQVYVRDPAIAKQLGMGGAPTSPVGKLTPVTGGPAPRAPGVFP